MAAISPATEFIWNVDMEVNLFHAMRGHKPAGVNKHFQMLAIHDKLSSASKKITSEDVWSHLLTLYDLRALNESEIVPFPNKPTDFSFPDVAGLEEQPFPRTSYISATSSEQPKQEGPSKNTPKHVGKAESKPTPQTPASSSKSESNKPESKTTNSSGKSQSQKGTPGGGGGTNTPKTTSTPQTPALFTPDPSPKRTKRTRNVSSAGASPATPTEPAAKRRR